MGTHSSKNLIPIKKGQLSKKEAAERGRSGGIKSGIAKREKKLMSEIYADFLAREHDVVISGVKQKVPGHKLIESVMSKVLASGESCSVSMLKEIREGTEGNKNILMNPDGTNLKSEGIKVVFVDADPKKQINDEHKTTK